jgi:hypothetical protein
MLFMHEGILLREETKGERKTHGSFDKSSTEGLEHEKQDGENTKIRGATFHAR